MILCSFLKSLNALGIEVNILNTWELLLLYKGSKPGSLIDFISGNSFCRNDSGALSAAIIMFCPNSNNTLIIGTQRVA